MSTLRFRYQTIEFGATDIHVRSLRDNQEFSDNNGAAEDLGISSASWPLFGILWAAGRVLAQEMYDYDITNKSILEVGCGIGLASLVLNHRHANITATDYHPEAEVFLAINTELNHDKKIPFIRTGWIDEVSTLGKFDVIIGSDVLYEHEHIELLSNFIHQHAAARCEIIIVDPGRGHHARFSKKMLALGYSHKQRKPIVSTDMGCSFSGQILYYSR